MRSLSCVRPLRTAALGLALGSAAAALLAAPSARAQQESRPEPNRQWLLAERISAPLAYAAIECGPASGRGAHLGSLFDDRTLRHLFAGDPSLDALERVLDLFAQSTGEAELVLNGLLPRAAAPALPLLIARVRLSEDGRRRIAAALADPSIARPGRSIAAHPCHELIAPSERRPGSTFEVVLLGTDLLVTNHRSALEQVLEGAAAVDTLADDPEFAVLRERLGGGAGTAFVHLDWRRLRERALASLGVGRTLLVSGLGLAAAERIALGFRVVGDRLRTTLLVDQPGGAGGLLAVARPVPVRELVEALPGHGIASLALSFEPQRLREVAAASLGGAGPSFHASLVGGCRAIGLDFDADIAARLGDTATARLVMIDGPTTAAAAAFGFDARSPREARALVEAISVRLRAAGFRVRAASERDPDLLVVRRDGVGEANLRVIGASIVVGGHSEALAAIAAAEQDGSRRDRAGAREATLDLLAPLLGEAVVDARRVVGVLAVDGAAWQPQTAKGSHAGVVVLDEDAVRVELVSRF